MANNLHYNTVTPLLYKVLKELMVAEEFKEFRLVGGTALSLHRGHRESVDIDLFTDVEYGSLDFKIIDNFLRINYPYVDTSNDDLIGFGKSYFVGNSANESIKLDVFYTDKFIDDIIEVDGIRLASVEEIIAMKLEVVSGGGRKKDFWDIHELMDDYSIDEMLALHEKRHPFTHDKENIKTKFKQFENADEEPNPVCVRGKHWELVKLDIIEFIETLT